jgi:hypothetical protein
MTTINKLFDSPQITDEGIEKIKHCRNEFSLFLNALSVLDPNGGREFSIVKTKLEEACFFMNKSIANNNLK